MFVCNCLYLALSEQLMSVAGMVHCNKYCAIREHGTMASGGNEHNNNNPSDSDSHNNNASNGVSMASSKLGNSPIAMVNTNWYNQVQK